MLDGSPLITVRHAHGYDSRRARAWDRGTEYRVLALRVVWPGLAEQPLQERPSREPRYNAAAANAAD